MKKQSTLIIALMAGAILSEATLIANANTVPYNITSTEVGDPGSGPAGSTPANFSINSAVSFSGGIYTYTYTLSNPANDPLSGFDVRFDTALAGTLTYSADGSPGPGTPALAIDFSNPNSSPESGTVVITSTVGPAIGLATAQDNGVWADNDVIIPNAPLPSIPDGGLTIALLGGAFAGLQALRRKLAC